MRLAALTFIISASCGVDALQATLPTRSAVSRWPNRFTYRGPLAAAHSGSDREEGAANQDGEHAFDGEPRRDERAASHQDGEHALDGEPRRDDQAERAVDAAMNEPNDPMACEGGLGAPFKTFAITTALASPSATLAADGVTLTPDEQIAAQIFAETGTQAALGRRDLAAALVLPLLVYKVR